MARRRRISGLVIWAVVSVAATAGAQQRAADGVTINDEGNPVYSTFSLCAIDPVTGQSGASGVKRRENESSG